MKKITFLAIGFMLSLISIQAQDWDSVSSGINGVVEALAVYNGELYAGGYFTRAGASTVKSIARWNGTSWSNVGVGINGQGYIEAMQVYSGDLYVAGNFDTAGGVPASNIAKWDGTNWSAVGSGIPGNGSSVQSFAIYNGNLIVGGLFTSPGNGVASWNGSVWSALGSGITGGNYTEGTSMVTYDSILYVGGWFTTAGGNPASNIAQWNGSTWSALGSGITGEYNNPTPFISVIDVFNHQLYVGGYFDTAGGVKAYNIARWNGSSWDSVSSGLGTSWAEPQSMLVANGELYVGGYIYNSGSLTINRVASWNGVNWDSVGAGFGSPFYDSTVSALVIYQSQIYAGGTFSFSGSNRTNSMARWGITLGISTIKANNAIAVYPNPNPGQFTLEVSGAESGLKNIEVYSVLGDKVFSSALPSYQTSNTIDLDSQPNGVYFYRVIAENGNLLGEGKIVIEK